MSHHDETHDPTPPSEADDCAVATVPDFGCRPKDPLMRLPKAGHFTRDADLCDTIRILGFVKAQPQVRRLIEEGFGVHYDPLNPDDDPALHEPLNPDDDPSEHIYPWLGRRRVKGSWPLAFLAYVIGARTSIQAWAHTHGSDKQLWELCEFREPPSYPTIHRRFAEMEACVARVASDGTPLPDGFERAKRWIVREARRHEPQIGRALHIDGTGVATRAAFTHSCPAHAACGQRQLDAAERRKNNSGPRRRKPAHGTRLPSASVSEINEQRHAQAEKPVEEAEDAIRAWKLAPLDADEVISLGLDATLAWWSQPDDQGVVHYYCSIDTTVGPRLYAATGRGRGKFWLGWISQKAVDAFTGLTIDADIQSAAVSEHVSYPELMERVHETVGLWPQHMTGDRGLGIKSVFEFNSQQGIGTALPWRRFAMLQSRHQLEDAVVDRHGVPRCQHCGAPGKTNGSGRGFVITEHGTPVVRFSCVAKARPECRGIQTVHCEHEPRLLQPLRLDDEIYNQLRHRHSNREHVHLHERQRYAVGGRDVAIRDYRCGIDWQRLRTNAGLMLDWFRLALRHGWFASIRHSTNNPDSYERVSNGRRLANILAAREKVQLDVPYGPAAAKHGYGFLDPPWVTHPPPNTRKRK
jgi:hypothetical protein